MGLAYYASSFHRLVWAEELGLGSQNGLIRGGRFLVKNDFRIKDDFRGKNENYRQKAR